MPYTISGMPSPEKSPEPRGIIRESPDSTDLLKSLLKTLNSSVIDFAYKPSTHSICVFSLVVAELLGPSSLVEIFPPLKVVPPQLGTANTIRHIVRSVYFIMKNYNNN